MTIEHSRMRREARTIEAMIEIYCHGLHGTPQGLCPDCSQLLAYSIKRLEKCPFKEHKTTCAKCPAHCYNPQMREQIKTAMRYAGMRMIYRHPILTLFHYLDNLKREPEKYK